MDSRSYFDKLRIVANQNLKEKKYWGAKLAGDLEKSSFTWNGKIPAADKGEYPNIRKLTEIPFEIKDELYEKLKKLSNDFDLKLYMILVTGLIAMLYKYTGNNDVIVGSTITRQEEEIEYVNTVLALRNQVDENTSFKELLFQVRKTILEAFEHQNYPIEVLVEDLNMKFSKDEFPLFDIILILENIQDRKYIRNINYNMLFSLKKIAGCLKGTIEYNSVIYDEIKTNKIIEQYMHLMGKMLANVDAKISGIEILTLEEKEKILLDFNNSSIAYPQDKTITELFDEQVERSPGNVSVLFGDIHLSYSELGKRSNQLARIIIRNGVKVNSIAAVILETSVEVIVAILAILKAGASYLPIDPQYAQERILFILKESGASLIITKEGLISDLSFIALKNISPKNLKIKITSPRPQIENFDSLPIPDRSLIDYKQYNQFIGDAMAKNTITIQATRGCPFKCAFCHKIWPKNHVYRSAENIYSEIKPLYDIGIKRFVFVDDIFNLNKDNCSRFFELIIKNNLKVQLFFSSGLRGDIITKDLIDLMVEAGTVDFDFSLESASPRIQRLIQKNLNIEKLKENIKYILKRHPHVIVGLQTMLGFPTETEEEALTTLDFIKDLKWIDFPYVHFLRIYPETDMAKIAIENGISEKAIEQSTNLAFHEYSATMPFSEEFSKMYQTRYLYEYFLLKERFIKVLQRQVKILTEDELIQKYDSFFPTEIKNFSVLLDLVGLSKEDLNGLEFLDEDYMAVPEINEKISEIFPKIHPSQDSLKVLLLDLSQFFSEDANILYDLSEVPLGLVYLLTYLNRQYKEKIKGKIAKSRIDFDNYDELKSIIKDFNPDVIGIRSLNYYKDFFHKSLSLIRQWRRDVPIIAGGPYATSSYPEVLSDVNVDIAVVGEGEITFSEIIGKILENDGKLPGEKILNEIKGIAFIENKKKFFHDGINREIILLDRINEELDKEDDSNIGSLNEKSDLAYIMYTSGSTGKPKGVMVEHRNVVAYLYAFYQEFKITSKDVIVQNSSYSFDIFVEELFPILLRGGKIAIPQLHEKENFYLLNDFIYKVNADILDCTPLLLNEVNNLNNKANIHTYISGGDILKKEHITNLMQFGRVYNTYGPTETTICATYYKCSNIEDSSIPIGKPIGNYKVYLLDKGNMLLPPGIPGELSIAGPGVTRGYLNNPELTAEKFVENPHLSQQTSPHHLPHTTRLYRTGDLAVWLPDGNIDFLGRIDYQVNIRGYRIELKEIEKKLLNHVDITEAVVVEKKKNGNHFLCAYYSSGKEIKKSELQDFVSSELPDYMVPGFFVALEKFPLTPGGKIDIKELRERDLASKTEYIAPGNEIEKILVEIWAEVLKIEKDTISIDANFFELGGHSLSATILIAKVHKALDVKVPLIEVFKFQTIRELSRYIQEAEKERFVSIEPVEKKEYYVSSSAQKRLYSVQQLDPDSTVYNVAFGYYLGENVNAERVRKPFLKLIERHEVLRSSFGEVNNEAVQRIHREVEFEVEYYKLGSRVAGNKEINEIMRDFRRSFDLSKAPLFRVGLVETNEKRYILLVEIHHIIIDAACVEILTRELISLYLSEELFFLKLQYKDYSEWQNRLKHSKEIKKQEEYWLKCYEGNVPLLELKTDFERPAIHNFIGDRIFLEIPENYTLMLKKEILRHGANVNVFLAVFNILLSKLTERENIIVGCPVSGRTHIDLQGIIGMFLNMLPLRNRPAGDKNYIEFLTEVKENTLQALENQDYQFDELVEKIDFKREPGRHPLVDAVLVVLDQDESAASVREQDGISSGNNSNNEKVEVKVIPDRSIGITSKFDLEIWVSEVRNKIVLALTYATCIFKRSTAVTILELYFDILRQVLENENIMLKDIKISTDFLTARSKISKDIDFNF